MSGFFSWLSDPAFLIVAASVLAMLPGLAALAMLLREGRDRRTIESLREKVTRLEARFDSDAVEVEEPVRPAKVSLRWDGGGRDDEKKEAPPAGMRFV